MEKQNAKRKSHTHTHTVRYEPTCTKVAISKYRRRFPVVPGVVSIGCISSGVIPLH